MRWVTESSKSDENRPWRNFAHSLAAFSLGQSLGNSPAAAMTRFLKIALTMLNRVAVCLEIKWLGEGLAFSV